MPEALRTAAEVMSSKPTARTVADVVTARLVASGEAVNSATIVTTGIATDDQSIALTSCIIQMLNFYSDHVKQTDQAWGAQTAGSEWDDEKAGEEIAKTEAKEGFDTSVNAPTSGEGEKPDGETGEAESVPQAEAEVEDKSKSYEAYMAEQAEKRMNLGSSLEARKANEGSKVDKKWAGAKALNKDDEEDSYIAARGGKAVRQRERKEKQTLEIDHRFQETPRGERGGRGRGRGGEFRGGDRGDRGDRGNRGDRGDRGGRGGRGRGDFRGEHRGEYRGGRGGVGRGGAGRGDNVNIADENAFPSLGA